MWTTSGRNRTPNPWTGAKHLLDHHQLLLFIVNVIIVLYFFLDRIVIPSHCAIDTAVIALRIPVAQPLVLLPQVIREPLQEGRADGQPNGNICGAKGGGNGGSPLVRQVLLDDLSPHVKGQGQQELRVRSSILIVYGMLG